MKMKKLTAFVLAGAMALSVALTGCGNAIDPNAVGATLNGEEISLGFMNFMAKYQQAMTDMQYVPMFGPDMWTLEISEGKTMEDSTKDGVAESIETIYLLEDHMADYGVEITEDELASMDAAAKKFMSDNSGKAIKQLGAKEEYVKEMLRLLTIQNKMHAAIFDASKAEVTEEEAAQRTFSYVSASIKTKDADNKTVDMTEEQKEELEKELEEFAKAAKDDFKKAAEDKDYKVSEHSYGKDDKSMDEAVIEAADAMKEGEISQVIKGENAYYVIRLDSEYNKEKTEEKKEQLLNQKKSDEYNEICEGYREEAEFEVNEAEWAKVKFDRLFGVPAKEE